MTHHYYQPSFTMVGGGVLSEKPSDILSKYENTTVRRPMRSLIDSRVPIHKTGVTAFDPENNAFETGEGRFTYDYLVVAAGIKLKYDQVEGATAALDDPDSPVCSIYRYDYALKTLRKKNEFKGGHAVFTLTKMPVKCGGAPQKILYLSENYWRRQGLRDNTTVHYHTSTPVLFPPCKKFSDKLEEIRTGKGIERFLNSQLTRVDKDNRTAVFIDNEGKESTENFDFLHISPPMGPGEPF